MYRKNLTLLAIALILVLASPATTRAGDGGVNAATGEAELSVNFRFPPTDQQIDEVSTALDRMASILCDATDGQFKVRRIRLTAGAAEEDRAEFWLMALPGRSGVSFYFDGSNFGTLGRRVIMYASAINRGDVLAHEFGHHGFGLGDQYDEQRRWGGACGIGRGFENGTWDEQNHSIMQQIGGVQCVGGANDGNRCLDDADCPGGSCQTILMSELSIPANHDLLRGDNVVCPAPQPITQIEFTGTLSSGDLVQVFDSTDFTSADATSSGLRDLEAIDDTGALPAARLKFYATRTDATEWQISAAVDHSVVGGAAGDLHLLEQWILTFNGDGSLQAVSEDPPDLDVTGLASGAADLAIALNFGTPNPGALPGAGRDGLVVSAGATEIEDSHDGFPACTAADCATRWNTGTARWETTQQSLIHGFDSDWETLVANYPFIIAPAGLPTANLPATCAVAVIFDEDVRGTDQALLIMDRSESMGWSSREDLAEVCDNGIDDDEDGAVDESECAEPRIEFARAAARAFVDLQADRGIEVGLLRFNNNNLLVRPIDLLDSTNVEDFKDDINDLRPGGTTAIGDALDASQAEFTRAAAVGRSQTAFLLTDGYNTAGGDPDAAADRLRAMDVRIYTIPTGTDVDSGLLSGLAAQTGGAMFEAREVNELPAVYAELAARYQGAGLIFPRHNFLLAKEPAKYGAEQEESEVRIERRARFLLPVEAGAKSLTSFISGRNKQMDSWRLRFQLEGPRGEFFDSGSPEVTVDPYYTFINVKSPSAGDWVLTVEPDNDELQESTLVAIVENPRPRFFSDVRPRNATPGVPVIITADPLYMVDLDGEDVTVDALVRRPDGSVRYVSLAQDVGGVWTAEFDDYAGRGVYEISLEANVGPDARPFIGEPIFEGPERAPIKVEPYRRFSTAQFFLDDPDFPPCQNLGDCDEDDIPDEKECGEDTDKDGVPDFRDTDSDNDEIPDAVEDLNDRNENGVPDACEPGPAIKPEEPKEKPGMDPIFDDEKDVIELLCSVRGVTGEAQRRLERSSRMLREVAEQAEDDGLLARKPEARGMFVDIFALKMKLLHILENGRASCPVARELLGKALEIEKELAGILEAK